MELWERHGVALLQFEKIGSRGRAPSQLLSDGVEFNLEQQVIPANRSLHKRNR